MDYLGIDFGCALRSLQHGKFPEKDCLLPLFSKLLGYFIVALSTTVKLPQILKILKNRSASGISATAVELEIVGFTIGLGYCIQKDLPFSAYGELTFLLIQGLILIAIIYYYSQPIGTTTWIRALLYCAIAPTILAGQINPVLFEALYESSNITHRSFLFGQILLVPFLLACQYITFFFARVPRIWKNFKNKSTGQLSSLTCLISFCGSSIKVFTSIQKKHQEVVVMGATMGFLLNGTILSQFLIYQKPQDKKEKKDK